MADQLCPVCAHQFEEGSRSCPQCGRPRPGVLPEYMNVPWQRAATYIGVISGVLLVCLLLLLAPNKATEVSPEKVSEPSAAESSAPIESSAGKETPGATEGGKGLVVNSWSCSREGDSDYIYIRGEVKNASDSSVDWLQIVVTLRTAEGKFVTSDRGFTEYQTILPGQTSPFKVMIGFNPAVRTADLSIKSNDRELVEFSGPHSTSCSGTGPAS
jgi:hypothetical protein